MDKPAELVLKYSFLHSQQVLYFRNLKTVYLLILLTIPMHPEKVARLHLDPGVTPLCRVKSID